MKSGSLVRFAVLLAYLLLAPGMLRLQSYLSLCLFTLAVTLAVVHNNKVLDRIATSSKLVISMTLTLAALLLM